jgi:hypothetical protein
MKKIIKHPFTYTLPADIYTFDYQKHDNLCFEKHPLNELALKIEKTIPRTGASDIPAANPYRLISTAYHDCYHNGGGNADRWTITKDFKKAIRAAKFDREVIKSLEQRLSNVFSQMCKGRRFGFPQYGYEKQWMFNLEILFTDVVYYCSEKMFPDELQALIDSGVTYSHFETA